MQTASSATTPSTSIPETEAHDPAKIACTLSGFRLGLRASVAIALGPLVWGISMGVVASDAGFSWFGSMLMSLLVFSGTAQMLAVDMVERDVGMIAILISSVLVSLRYTLMGMTMSGWFRTTPRLVFWPGIHYLSDQSWAMTIQQMRTGYRDVGYFFGLNAGMGVTWALGTLVGTSIGGVLGGQVDGLHFASTAALVGILAGMEIRRKDVLPWVAAGIAAIVTSEILAGSWPVFIGIAAGLAATFVMGGDDADR